VTAPQQPLRGATPSQTVGPFFRFGVEWLARAAPSPSGTPIVVTGTVFDGDGRPVPDAMLETWQANGEGRFGEWGFARCLTGADGGYRVTTVKPGPVPAADGTPQAPHIDVSVFARGLLQRLVTRVYFPDESEANDADPVLSSIGDAVARASLVAAAVEGGLRFDIHLQGDEETAFFAF
jgi:protocatechuate 3,4-dioxygenase, alpha subunit